MELFDTQQFRARWESGKTIASRLVANSSLAVAGGFIFFNEIKN